MQHGGPWRGLVFAKILHTNEWTWDPFNFENHCYGCQVTNVLIQTYINYCSAVSTVRQHTSRLDVALQVAAYMYGNFFQSINPISIASISLAKPGSVARQPNQRLTAKLKKQFHGINGLSGVPVSKGGKGQVKEMCLHKFLDGSNWNGWADRQWRAFPERQEWEALVPVLALTLGTDTLTPCLISANDMRVMGASME